MQSNFPTYVEVVSILGVDPQQTTDPVTLDPAVLLDVVQLFLKSVTVDDERYGDAYPDVAESVADGSLESAQQHFLEYGYYEGRSPCPAESDDS